MHYLEFSSKTVKSIVAVCIGFSSIFNVAAQVSNAQPAKQNAGQVSAAQQTPTQVVKSFYQNLKEQRFREALMLTNWRPAVENFTPQEAEDLRSNFKYLAAQASVEITGEQLSNNAASVFVKGVDAQSREMKVEEVRLRREDNNWVIVLGDAETEAALKREGKNYFYRLWMENRHREAQYILEDIYKAELIYSMTGDGSFADLNTLVNKRLLSADVLGTEVGYRFRVQLAPDKKKYSVNAEPLQYGKTGKLSFLLEIGKDGKPVLKSNDNNGAPYAIKN
ncbi:MAG: hypothetical protein M3209_20450 [Acidobacteriota bacterium]|nr:hypothetical protein [Acidobacteriota bacterium]